MSDQQKQLIIRSGGQTGVDRAALDAAMAMGLVVCGWCPHGRLAEDGPIDLRYPLVETKSDKYSIRTDWNVRDADATLIISPLPLEGGTLLTEQYALTRKKPCLAVAPDDGEAADKVVHWLRQLNIDELNVAGPRESKQPGVYRQSVELLTTVLTELQCLSSH